MFASFIKSSGSELETLEEAVVLVVVLVVVPVEDVVLLVEDVVLVGEETAGVLCWEFNSPGAAIVLAVVPVEDVVLLGMETAGVLAAQGIRAFIFDDLRTTPELSFAVRHQKAAGGVVITASHNPPEYNGYKLYDEHGCQLVPRYTDELCAIIDQIDDPLSIQSLTPEQAGELITVLGKEVDEAYYQAVMGIRLNPDVEKDDFLENIE